MSLAAVGLGGCGGGGGASTESPPVRSAVLRNTTKTDMRVGLRINGKPLVTRDDDLLPEAQAIADAAIAAGQAPASQQRLLAAVPRGGAGLGTGNGVVERQDARECGSLLANGG